MAWVQSSAQNAWYEDQALTRTAPSTSTDGVPLDDLSGVTIAIEANSGQTLSGSGTIRCYLYDTLVGAWFRVPECDLSVSTSGVRRLGFATLAAAGRTGARVDFVTDTVTVSSGTTARVYVLGTV